MKYLLLILDGAADVPLPELDGRTPLEAARLPHLDVLRRHGQTGRMTTAVPGLPLESAVCTLRLLGYAPAQVYPGGRASFEALGQGLHLGPRDLALRCNLIGVTPDSGGLRLTDFTAGNIRDSTARALLADMPTPAGWELHPGQSYRNLLLVRDILPRTISDGASYAGNTGGAGAGEDADVALPVYDPIRLICAEPHHHVGERLDTLWPRAGDGAPAAIRTLAGQIHDWMHRALRTLPHVPAAHTALAHQEGQIMPWVWSPSRAPALPAFATRHGVSGAVVAGLAFMRGIGVAAGLQVPDVPGATGGPDTDLNAKTQAAITAWNTADLSIVHLNAPDEAAHQRNALEKIRALEAADAVVLGPLLAHLAALRQQVGMPYRVMVCADHPTLCTTGCHGDAPPCWICCDSAALAPHTGVMPTPPEPLGSPVRERGKRWEQALSTTPAHDAPAISLLMHGDPQD